MLKWGVAAGAVAPLVKSKSAKATTPATVQKYYRLGRTELEVSDISMGTARLRTGQEYLVHRALDRGINYFDSAFSYGRGQSETTLGKALKGIREESYIVSKAETDASAKVSDFMHLLDTSLTRLQTDYIDVYMCHAVNDPARITSEDWLEFVTRAKEQGKIRFGGMSGHGGRLMECLDIALDQDITDVILVAYNFGTDPAFYERFTRRTQMVATQPDMRPVLKRAKKNDIGVTVMKTLMGARLNDMEPFEVDGSTYSQAAFRWVLSNENVDAVVISMSEEEQIDEFLGASGADRLAYGDMGLLDKYYALNSASQCRQGCAVCLGSCPYGVQIGEVLRTRMYAVEYKDLEMARDEYARIGTNADACLSCSGEPCANACTFGVEINQVCGPTHTLLA